MKKLLPALAIAALFAACNMGGDKNKTMDDRMAKNKADMMKFYDEVMNKHNPAMFDSCVTADFVEHEADPNVPPTRDGTKKIFASLFSAYPDFNEKVNFMIADSNTVVTHYTMTGTNTGAMMGMPATGKKINIDGVDIVTFNKDGKGTAHWGYNEEMKMMMQLGMMPGMGGDTSKMKMPDGDKTMKDKK